MNIGIMQGRLVPPVEGHFQCFPRDRWADEFKLAATAGLTAIEWIYDLFGADMNPLATDAGIEQIKSLATLHHVAVRSVCADYFMDKPFLRTGEADIAERVATLKWLLERCQLADINRVVLPFVDVSRIETPKETDQVVEILNSVVETAMVTNVEIHLETSLSPNDFAALLEKIPHPMVKVNYDSGNSASLGYDVSEEIQAYGNRIGSVHIKDRVRGAGTVPLGKGDADLSALATELKKCGYSNDLILQVARGIPGDEVAWARQNRIAVEKLWGAPRQ